YVTEIVPKLCKEGSEDGHNGSSATRDVEVLQLLSRRIYFGKFVAEAKFKDPLQHEQYVNLIKAQDADGIMLLLTNKKVEDALLKRLRVKASTYGREINETVSENSDSIRINPQLIVDLYEKFVIPLTKQVEVEYLLKRLDYPFDL
ncbi:chorismate mutase aro7, partial [Nowakowskiella sp. JEL0407]